MAITKVGAMTDPPVAGDYAILQAKLDAYAKQIGNQGMILTQWTNTTTAPKIAMGSYITHGGTLFVVDTEDFAVPAPAGDGTYYLKVAASGATLALSWVASLSGYTWNAIYNGLYHADESQILPYQLVKAGAVLTKRKITNLMQGSGFVTVDWTGSISGGAISGASLDVTTYNGFTGMIAPFAVATAQAGWLKCDGAAYSRSTFSFLFAVIGTVFGAGDGSTTFNVPDLRGEFLRGVDDGRGIDTGRVFGSTQSDLLKAHTHSYTTIAWETPNSYPGEFSNANDISSKGATTGSTGGTETRPRNIAILYCIKY